MGFPAFEDVNHDLKEPPLVWLEAPANTGKSTLIAEFFRIIPLLRYSVAPLFSDSLKEFREDRVAGFQKRFRPEQRLPIR